MRKLWTAVMRRIFIVMLCIGGLHMPADAQDDPAKALHKLGEQRLREGRYKEAVQTFSEMIEKCGDKEVCRGVAQFYLGRACLESAEYEKASEFLAKALVVFSKPGREERKASTLLAQGRLFAEKGKYREALSAFTEAEHIFENTKNYGELFFVLNSLAVVYSRLGNHEAATEALTKAEKTPAQGAERDFTLACNTGFIASVKQDYDTAKRQYEFALGCCEASGNLKGLCTVLNNVGELHESRSEYTDALRRHEESLKIARELGNPSLEAFGLNNIGGIHLKRGNYEAALEAYEKAFEIRTRIGRKHQAAESLNNRGLVHFAFGDFSKAANDFRTAQKECKEVGSLCCQAYALHNLAYTERDQGNLRDAISHAAEALELAEKSGDTRLEATVTLRLGNLHDYNGLFDQATKYYNRAAEIQRAACDLNFLSKTLVETANSSVRRGDMQTAEVSYLEALACRTRIGAPQVDVLCSLALFFIERKQYAAETAGAERAKHLNQAAEYIARAERECNPENVNDLMLVTYTKGRLALEKDPQKAVEEFETLKALCASTPLSKFAFLTSVGLGIAYENLEQWSEAERAFRSAKDYAEDIRRTLPAHMKVSFLHGEEILGIKHSVPFEGLARVLLRRGDARGAFGAAEYTKARAFAEKLARQTDKSSLGAPEEVVTRDAEMNNQLAGLLQGIQLAQEKGENAATASLTRQIKVVEAKLKGHVARLRIEYPVYAATKYPQPLELEETKLRDQEWIVSYDVTDSGVLVFLTQGKELAGAWFKPIPRRDLDTLVRRFRDPTEILDPDTAADKLRSFDFAAGKALSDILVGDILAYVAEKAPLKIIPDDSLSLLPFEMLVMNEGGSVTSDGEIPTVKGGVFFGDRHPISYYQSITALTLFRTVSQRKSTGERVLVIADPIFEMADTRVIELAQGAPTEKPAEITLMGPFRKMQDGGAGLCRLPMTSRLAGTLATLFPGKADVYTGLKASKNTFLEDISPRLEEYGLVVMATHGYFDEENPGILEPILVLTMVPPGTDGILRMSEVLGLKMNADLVALVACQSGLGKRISGEGAMGMGRAFQFGGARSVLTSLWSISEYASVSMVESFFGHIKNGKAKLEALQAARAEIRSKGFDHPFFWAPFILVGEVD